MWPVAGGTRSSSARAELEGQESQGVADFGLADLIVLQFTAKV